MKKRKIKWGNVIKLLILTLCLVDIGYMLFQLLVKMGQLTYLGLASFILDLFIISAILEDFNDQTKNIPSDKH